MKKTNENIGKKFIVFGMNITKSGVDKIHIDNWLYIEITNVAFNLNENFDRFEELGLDYFYEFKILSHSGNEDIITYQRFLSNDTLKQFGFPMDDLEEFKKHKDEYEILLNLRKGENENESKRFTRKDRRTSKI